MTLKINQDVTFTYNGNKFEGKIKKLNPKKAKVLLTKGYGRFATGKVIGVPYSFFGATDYGWQVGAESGSTPVAKPKPVPLKASSFWVSENYHALHILDGIFSNLSPENLTCDGEAGAAYVRARHSVLMSQLKAVHLLLNQEVTEDDLYNIQKQFPAEYEGKSFLGNRV